MRILGEWAWRMRSTASDQELVTVPLLSLDVLALDVLAPQPLRPHGYLIRAIL